MTQLLRHAGLALCLINVSVPLTEEGRGKGEREERRGGGGGGGEAGEREASNTKQSNKAILNKMIGSGVYNYGDLK